MNSYKLSTLLRLRELEKDYAERCLYAACVELEDEQKKLSLIKNQLEQKKRARTHMYDNFYYKAQKDPSNKRETSCFTLLAKKNIYDERYLRGLLTSQIEQVKGAEIRRNQANHDALEAHQEFKAISKHHSSWQQQEKRREENMQQNNSDDQNCARFCLRSRENNV